MIISLIWWYYHSTKYACQIFYAWYILSFRKNGFALLLKAFGLLLIQTKLEQGTNQGSHFAWLFVHWWYFIAVKTFVFMYNLTVDIALYFSASAMTKLWHYYTNFFVKMFFIVYISTTNYIYQFLNDLWKCNEHYYQSILKWIFMFQNSFGKTQLILFLFTVHVCYAK